MKHGMKFGPHGQRLESALLASTYIFNLNYKPFKGGSFHADKMELLQHFQSTMDEDSSSISCGYRISDRYIVNKMFLTFLVLIICGFFWLAVCLLNRILTCSMSMLASSAWTWGCQCTVHTIWRTYARSSQHILSRVDSRKHWSKVGDGSPGTTPAKRTCGSGGH